MNVISTGAVQPALADGRVEVRTDELDDRVSLLHIGGRRVEQVGRAHIDAVERGRFPSG